MNIPFYFNTIMCKCKISAVLYIFATIALFFHSNVTKAYKIMQLHGLRNGFTLLIGLSDENRRLTVWATNDVTIL